MTRAAPTLRPEHWAAAHQWYDRNADEFELQSLELDTSDAMTEFLDGMPEGAQILDAGCGVGRDIRRFQERGFQAAGFDASEEMCRAARCNTRGKTVIRCLSFDQYCDPARSWDGIWAMASLLHVPRYEWRDILDVLMNSLTPDGRLFVSVKIGEGEEIDVRGRPMAYTKVEDLLDLLAGAAPRHGHVEAWETASPASGGEATRWANAIAYRAPR